MSREGDLSNLDGLIEYSGTPEFREKVEIIEQVLAALPEEQVADARSALIRGCTREQAIAYGRALGEHEASIRRETGAGRESRIRRAMAYAAWEWDGRPAAWPQREEFGVDLELTPSLRREMERRKK
jgi:hypothetical protein